MAGKRVKLKWGPNYLETYQNQFCEISVWEMVIWTTRPAMNRTIYQREGDPGWVVIENQSLLLQMISGRVMTPFYIRTCPNARMGHRVKVSYRGSPLITKVAMLRERGRAYQQYEQKICRIRSRCFFEGTQPERCEGTLQGPQLEPKHGMWSSGSGCGEDCSLDCHTPHHSTWSSLKDT